MAPRDYRVHVAPSSVEAYWLILDDGLLHIWVNPDMDDVAQQRYIAAACRMNSLTPKRRHTAAPIALATNLNGSLHTTGMQKTVAAVVTTGLVAGTAAVILPSTTTLARHQVTPARQPSASAPPTVTPEPPRGGTRQSPAVQPIQTTRKATPHPLPTSITPLHLRVNTPVTGPVGTPHLAKHLPASLPRVRPPVPPVLADPPAPAVHPACVVRVDAAGIRVRVCLRT